jgi:uncharacterized protein YdeI (YjbR/CyaY-like superfamily)
MGKRIPEVDAYIAKAAPFAQPILEKIRDAFHAASPEVTEVMKWSAPFFDYKGMLGNMAAFKNHVSWGFWKAQLMKDPHGILSATGEGGSMFGGKASSVKDLPSKKVMLEYIKEAMRLNDEGVKIKRGPSARSATPLEVPADLSAALEKDKRAKSAFEAFSPSQKREYVEWLNDARQDATRAKRLATAVEWMAEGKPRNWKYMKK